MQNKLKEAINTPDRDEFLRAHAEPLLTLDEIRNRSLDKALKGVEENLDANSVTM